jgi:hypothetical protein
MNFHLRMKSNDYQVCLAKMWEGSAAICVIVTNKAVKARLLSLSQYTYNILLSFPETLSQYPIYMQYLPSSLTFFTLRCPFSFQSYFPPGLTFPPPPTRS